MNFARPAVLSFSSDFNWLITRQVLLERCECTVLCAMGIPEFRERLKRRSVDLIVLCQTLSPEQRAAALDIAHAEAPQARCLLMYTRETLENALPECALLDTGDGPAAFVKMVIRLLKTIPVPMLQPPFTTQPRAAA